MNFDMGKGFIKITALYHIEAYKNRPGAHVTSPLMASDFTEEELAAAKEADLCDVAGQLGYTVKRKGRFHTLAEMDSVMIYNRRSWCRWSRIAETGSNGGSQIDFLRVFAGMEVKDAVFWLLDFTGYKDIMTERKKTEMPVLRHQASRHTEKEKQTFILPGQAENNDILYRYLATDRAVPIETVDFFVGQGLVYEECQHHNIVFKGNDKNGITRFASMRGTDGSSFKCDVAGNDKNYGFNIWNDRSGSLYVFEAAIDLMSFTSLYGDYESNKLALGMLHDAPLATFLKEHPQVKTFISALTVMDQAGKQQMHYARNIMGLVLKLVTVRRQNHLKITMNGWYL